MEHKIGVQNQATPMTAEKQNLVPHGFAAFRQFGLTSAIHHPKSDLERHSHFPGAQPFSSTVVVHTLHYPAALANIHSETLVVTAFCGPAVQGQRNLKVTGAHPYWI